MHELLEKIRDFADKAHGEQMRKYVLDRYIIHPVRVMELVSQYTEDVAVLAAALLHDVLEDTSATAHEIDKFLSSLMNEAQRRKTLRLVKELTDEFVKAKYPEMNRRRRKEKEVARLEKVSSEAQTIKYSDIIDNAREIVSHDADFASVYLRECGALLRKMNKGNQQLYEMAMLTVQDGIDELKKKKVEI
jgi:guanosine-3',5'-bis(diphosphate) 3'-pyrophosphohydrolase